MIEFKRDEIVYILTVLLFVILLMIMFNANETNIKACNDHIKNIEIIYGIEENTTKTPKSFYIPIIINTSEEIQ